MAVTLKTKKKRRTRTNWIIPRATLLAAINRVQTEAYELHGPGIPSSESWDTAERMLCRQYCGEEYKHTCLDWLEHVIDNIRKSGDVISFDGSKRRKYKAPNGWLAEYLETDHWQSVSDDCLSLWGGCCCLCREGKKLHVVHSSYDRLDRERGFDVVPLCHECLMRVHSRMPYEDQFDSQEAALAAGSGDIQPPLFTPG